MKRFLILLEFCLLAASAICFGQVSSQGAMLATEQPKKNGLSATEKAYILSRFCTEVKYNFAFYNQLDFNWEAACEDALPKLVATSTNEEFLKGMQALCAKLHDGHTFIYSTKNPKNQADWVRPLPMKTKRIGDKVLVTNVYSSVLQNAGVTPGCEIVKIDGDNVQAYANENIKPYLASSTPQWTNYRPFAEFELTKDKGSKESTIVFRDKKGKEFTVTTNRNIAWDLAQNSAPMSFEVLKGNVGLLTVTSFQNSDFDRSVFDKLYDEILKTDALIIDIRDNGGGNSSHADYLMSHFSTTPIPQGAWSSPMYIAAHGSWNYPPEYYMQTPHSITPVRNKEIYKKPVVLVVNATTFSSAENLCVSFRGAKRGQIIGTPTGGSTGNPIRIDLGGGIACCICTKHELDAEGNEFIGIGIQPDIIVNEDENIFLKGTDRVITKALEILTKQ